MGTIQGSVEQRDVGGRMAWRWGLGLLVIAGFLSAPLVRTLRSQSAVPPTPVRINAGRQIGEYVHVLSLYASTADSDDKVRSILRPWLGECPSWLDRLPASALTSDELALVTDIRSKLGALGGNPPQSVADLGHATLDLLALESSLDKLSRALLGGVR